MFMGSTVYNYLHIGTLEGDLFNLVRNWLEKSGYEVTYVYNYTDGRQNYQKSQ